MVNYNSYLIPVRITCVAMPTGQVLRWHFLIIVHPMAMSGAVLKPISSAPRRAAITTSLP